jgi:hypothetical protein
VRVVCLVIGAIDDSQLFDIRLVAVHWCYLFGLGSYFVP